MKTLEETLERITGLDEETMLAARRRQDQLTKPEGSLGLLEDIAVKIAGITGNPIPEPGRKSVVVIAADHGVVEEGVSLYPPDVTPQMVLNILHGGAAINALSRHVGAHVLMVDIGVASTVEHPELLSRNVRPGTASMAAGPAMTREEATAAVEIGIDVALEEISSGADFLAVGDMGIGNSTAASAIAACVTGLDPGEVTGRGTGIDDDTLEHKVDVIRRSLDINRPDPGDPLDVLSKVGGLEIAGIAGVIIGSAAERRPVVIDGFITSAGALIAAQLCPRARDFMIASHLSVEKGHGAIHEALGLTPLIDAKMRLGEGTGAVLALMLVDASLKAHAEMATFEEAGVSGPEEE